jgi:5-formyltetrahydrofolate cyclo-ligase
MTDKTALRQQLRYMCQTRMPAFNTAYANDLAIKAMAIIREQDQAEWIGLYYPLPDEVDSRLLTQMLRLQGYHLALPLVTARDKALSFRAWHAGDLLDKGVTGLAQPNWAAPVVEPDIVIVPILGFNTERYRLGRGGGHYDRTLADRPDIVTIGLAASFQSIAFDPEPHDKGLDYIVTETTVLSAGPKTAILSP